MTPEMLTAIASVLSAVAWPLVVVTLLLTQREGIRFIIESLETISIPGVADIRLRKQVDKEARAAIRRGKSDGDVPDDLQIRAAKRVERITLKTDIEAVRRQVLSLAHEYDRIRASTPYSLARTRQLELIVAKMRTLGLSMSPFLDELVHSSSAGERLATIAALQIQPREDLLDWLASRISEEKPFIGYHAAVALRVAVRVLYPGSLDSLRQAIKSAKGAEKALKPDSDRRRVLDAAEGELKDLSEGTERVETPE